MGRRAVMGQVSLVQKMFLVGCNKIIPSSEDAKTIQIHLQFLSNPIVPARQVLSSLLDEAESRSKGKVREIAFPVSEAEMCSGLVTWR